MADRPLGGVLEVTPAEIRFSSDTHPSSNMPRHVIIRNRSSMDAIDVLIGHDASSGKCALADIICPSSIVANESLPEPFDRIVEGLGPGERLLMKVHNPHDDGYHHNIFASIVFGVRLPGDSYIIERITMPVTTDSSVHTMFIKPIDEMHSPPPPTTRPVSTTTQETGRGALEGDGSSRGEDDSILLKSDDDSVEMARPITAESIISGGSGMSNRRRPCTRAHEEARIRKAWGAFGGI
ncbi:hypothetical protein FOL47_006184 [Perkinsus chesapeaki]|uniref:Uncharacterized protein n=1 Tax=Perkinsus chesapeaki TaxID=330153 RepID=A0A7J6LTE1_PERCH|nr:hypothetical protein FOL47_006184 [Perkinsus chesapeaki]